MLTLKNRILRAFTKKKEDTMPFVSFYFDYFTNQS
uniref:Uncharacterized protein n=1 Tax=Arundo donax TaxID=35708 RepID=A0A0A9BYA6_ARUDO